MSKLLTEPKTGYVKPKDGVSSGIYPKTLVDAVYNEEKGESLSETLKELESQGGGSAGQIIVSTGDWSNIRHDGTNELTREECIELVGMNEDDFDRLFSDEDYFPDIKIVAEGVISIYKAFNKLFLTGDTPNKIMEWCVPYFNNAEYNGEMHSIAIEINTSGNYVVYGLGSTGPIIG